MSDEGTPGPDAAQSVPSTSGSPTDFLKGVVGKRVVVRLVSGVDYRGMSYYLCVHHDDPLKGPAGVLTCLDGFMNIALEQTEEHVKGKITNRYGDTFIRGNNGEYISSRLCLL
jgi:U6 snRNA-associated Sm-like protein LSm6